MADHRIRQRTSQRRSNSCSVSHTEEKKRSLSSAILYSTLKQLQNRPGSPRIYSDNEYLRLLLITPIIKYPHYMKYIAKGATEKAFVHEAKAVHLTSGTDSSWIRTVRILLNLKHHNVSSYLAVERRGTCVYVAECCADYTTIQTLIESARITKRYIKESVIWEILYHVLSGLAYLHVHAQHTIPWANTITHGAIAPENILLLDDEVAVLSSCALWNIFPIYRFDIHDTKTYLMAPEVIVDPKNMTTASDIWAVGAVFYELLTLRPFARDCQATDIDGLLQKFYDKVTLIPPEFPEYSDEITDIVRRMLHMDPRLRPSVEELLTNKHILYAKYRATRIRESAAYMIEPSASQMIISNTDAVDTSVEENRDSTIFYNKVLLTTKSRGLSLVRLNLHGETRLMHAVKNNKHVGLMNLVKEESGAQSADGMTALMYAALFNNLLAVGYLVDKEARLVDRDGNSALIFAIHSNFRRCAEMLAPYEGGIVNGAGETALMYATRSHYSDIMQLLAEKDAGVQNNKGDTALTMAIRMNYKDGVRILAPLERHIGLVDGTTPEMLAIKLGFADLGEFIKAPTH